MIDWNVVVQVVVVLLGILASHFGLRRGHGENTRKIDELHKMVGSTHFHVKKGK